MSFPQWLRSNFEYHLLCEAQYRAAGSKGFKMPKRSSRLNDRFWRLVIIPVYQILPWPLKKRIMQLLPGSHRKSWPRRYFRSPGA